MEIAFDAVDEELTTIVEVLAFHVRLPAAGVDHGVPVDDTVHVPDPIFTTLVDEPDVTKDPDETL